MKCPVCGKDVEPFVLDTGSPIQAKRIVMSPEIKVEFAPRVKLRAMSRVRHDPAESGG